MKTLKLILISLIGLFSLGESSIAQVHFEQSLNWQQILEKAKNEHKYIFVDCNATWCVPCKMMEKEVYMDTTVGRFINSKFIAVQVQMDKTLSDIASVKAWYADAQKLQTDYHINAYPSLLFFNTDGHLLHKSVGYEPALKFMVDALKATDPNYEEYALLEKYLKGQLPDWQVPNLIGMLNNADDKEQGTKIAHQYINGYLLKLPSELLLKKDNIQLIGRYIEKTDDPGFIFFYQNHEIIDQVMQKDYASYFIVEAITNTEINPKLWSDAARKMPVTDKPDWTKLYAVVAKKYNNYYADLVMSDPKITWYKQHKQWVEYIGLEIDKIKKIAIDSTGHLINNANGVNNFISDYIVNYSSDIAVWALCLNWQKQVVEQNPNEPDYIDTYANLLFKSGDRTEAITQEKKALALKESQFLKNKGDIEKNTAMKAEDKAISIKDQEKELDIIRENLAKIEANKPTWNTDAK